MSGNLEHMIGAHLTQDILAEDYMHDLYRGAKAHHAELLLGTGCVVAQILSHIKCCAGAFDIPLGL